LTKLCRAESGIAPADISYFVEWGQRGWRTLLSTALNEFVGTELQGAKVLEIGARYGRMSCFFALLGAEVWAVDANPDYLRIAAAEAAKWGVQTCTHFDYAHRGALSGIQDGFFDLVFTKSVLVTIPELGGYLGVLSSKLRPGGKVVFLENAYGNSFFHLLRCAKHRTVAGLRRTRYFGSSELALMRQLFDVHMIRKTLIPPVVLICGYRKAN
jgi:2-polyprenyl-3-methyl-5-hydroxy-6-metoxy-1,4-benzoquinol methylase